MSCRTANAQTSSSLKRVYAALVIVVSPALCMPALAQQPGNFELTIIDEASKKPTPARVELVDAQGKGYVADDALPIDDGDCRDRERPFYVTFERAVGVMRKSVTSPYSKSTQFYSVGNSTISSLPPGNYKVTVRKGPEYSIRQQNFRIEPGQSTKLTVVLARWINLRDQGWYSADDHLHIPRPTPELNPFISKWMQAEDLHVANLLQWGNPAGFHNTVQHSHGSAGLYQEGEYILAAGQENPRTHLLGHTILLGTQSPINFPDEYLSYASFWGEAKRQGALNGYAHWGILAGGEYGLAVGLPSGLVTFAEVLQFDVANYSVWYNALNTGFRITPVAGTDYPCGAFNLPGRERFYTKVEGSLTFDSWLDGIRRGRTFVTNGPMLELRVNGQGIGAQIVLKEPGSVDVEGSVRFDPSREVVDRLEVIVDGDLYRSIPRKGTSSEISFRFPYNVTESSWIAVRASGAKHDEAPAVLRSLHTSAAHSAPTYISIEGAAPISAQPRARILARHWLALLDDLEARLDVGELQYLASDTHIDGFPTREQIKVYRPGLLKAIESAREYYRNLQR